MDPRQIATLIFLFVELQSTYGIIGYDCGSASANITTPSLLNIEECDIPKQSVNSSRVYIQLLQINEFDSVKVIQCKVEIDRLIRKCGMFSHSMGVFNGKYSFIQEVTREACRRMHTYGTFLPINRNLYNWIKIESNHDSPNSIRRSCRFRWIMLRKRVFRSIWNVGGCRCTG